jgi:hypothetical protein
VLKTLAPSADLLTGAKEPPKEMGFVWEPGIPLPWGQESVLRHGRRSCSAQR